ncbi:MAG: NADH-quinone oxidoreductase subunit N [Chloroflexales bacterium]|nr:NADH-quinone oxidoreductase subunit N [Chloroflexales bacterium]
MLFQLTDIPRILPEILLLVLALLVLGSDIFERWGSDEAAQRERSRSAGSLTAIGLGLIFAIALLQSGYVYTLPETAQINFFTNIIRNLQNGGPNGDTIIGVFATDHLTMIARLTVIGAAFLTTLLTLDYRPTGNPGEFYALILFSTAGMTLMAGATELIIAYLALELTSIPLYILTGYFREETESSEAGMKYFLFGALSSCILLYGMSLVYGFTATTLNTNIAANNLTQFSQIAQVAQQAGENTALLTLGMIFIIAGLGYKIGVVPFHSWSPDVYQGAPTPITAFISTASKTAGFLLLYRLLITAFPGLTGTVAEFDSFGGWTSLLALLTLLTVIIGNLAALPQTNAKRLLAYSSIAHAGFLLMGLVAWASPLNIDRELATSALLYYLIVYTLTNIAAFGALAVIDVTVGGDEISDLNGLAQRNLGLAVLTAISVLSLAGIPPLAGFFAKFYVFMAAWQSGAYWLVIGGVITTVVALYYYLRLLKAMFINAPISTEPVSTPLAVNMTLILATVALIGLGVFPNVILQVISQVQTVAGG